MAAPRPTHLRWARRITSASNTTRFNGRSAAYPSAIGVTSSGYGNYPGFQWPLPGLPICDPQLGGDVDIDRSFQWPLRGLPICDGGDPQLRHPELPSPVSMAAPRPTHLR